MSSDVNNGTKGSKKHPTKELPQTDLTKLSSEELIALVNELSEKVDVLSNSKSRVGLNFKHVPEDGNEALVALNAGMLPVLTKDETLSLERGDTGNLTLIESENLAALFALQETHKEKVDVIYIDPPYNTGNDFVYHDTRAYVSTKEDLASIETHEDGHGRKVGKDDPFRHSKWLSFMERRLFLARRLLSDTGVIIMAIGEDENANLKVLAETIFGPSNFVANIVWNGGRKNDSRYISVGHDYMLIFAKNREALNASGVKWRETKPGLDRIFAAAAKIWEKSNHDPEAATLALKAWYKRLPQGDPALGSKHYNRIDENGRIFFPSKISGPGGWQGPRYEVLHPVTGNPVPIPEAGWGYTEKTMRKLLADGDIHFRASDKVGITKKSYLDKITQQVVESVFYHDRRGSTKLLKDILGADAFDYPKDHNVLMKWINLVSCQKKDAIILDFFAGSGSTGHAVAAMNSQDGGTRSAILVTNNEGGIARNVTQRRLQRVLTGQEWADGRAHEPLPGNLHYYKLEFVDAVEESEESLIKLSEKMDGLLSLENNTFIPVSIDGFMEGTVYRNSDTAIVIWQNFDCVSHFPYAPVLKKVRDALPDVKLIGYLPCTEESYIAGLEDWEVHQFPSKHLRNHYSTLDMMHRNKILPETA